MSSSFKERAELFFDYDMDPTSCELWLGSKSDESGDESGTDYQMTERAVKGLRLLDAVAYKRAMPITILTTNFGGDVYHGLAIYAAIKACRSPVEMHVYGAAMSAGAYILQAANMRYMDKRARLMLHYGESSASAHAHDFSKAAKEQEELNKIMENIFLSRMREADPSWSRAKLRKRMGYDWYMAPEDALYFGLIDGILNNE